MDLDSSLPRHARLTDGRPLIGWALFYAVVVAAWVALIGLGNNGLGSLLARCLAPVAETAWFQLFLMWSLMSLAMMLPTSVPTLSRLSLLVQQRPQPILRFAAFLLAYIAIWLVFSAVATAAQLMLAGIVSPAFEPLIAAGLLAAAGIYQFSRLKQACLTKCRASHDLLHGVLARRHPWRHGDGPAPWPRLSGLLLGADVVGAHRRHHEPRLDGTRHGTDGFRKLAGTGRFVTAPLGVILIAGAFYQFGGFIFAA